MDYKKIPYTPPKIKKLTTAQISRFRRIIFKKYKNSTKREIIFIPIFYVFYERLLPFTSKEIKESVMKNTLLTPFIGGLELLVKLLEVDSTKGTTSINLK